MNDPESLFAHVRLDFADICTNAETHLAFTEMAAARGLSVVCQKPMATTLEEAERMVDICRSANVPLYFNENWRWQHPIRQFKTALDRGNIGRFFARRLIIATAFPCSIISRF